MALKHISSSEILKKLGMWPIKLTGTMWSEGGVVPSSEPKVFEKKLWLEFHGSKGSIKNEKEMAARDSCFDVQTVLEGDRLFTSFRTTLDTDATYGIHTLCAVVLRTEWIGQLPGAVRMEREKIMHDHTQLVVLKMKVTDPEEIEAAKSWKGLPI